jgi:hypothetical protein
MNIADIQRRLVELGFDAGPADGIAGRRTKAAIRAAQRWHGLKADGIVGPLTKAALWPDALPERDSDPPERLVPRSASPWPRQGDVPAFFGATGGNQVMLELPFAMRLAWKKTTVVRRFSIHAKVHDSAVRAFARIAETYDAAKRREMGIDLFGGCLNVRKMRGGSRWSMHSWGIAIDFDPARNPLRGDIRKSRLMQPDADAFWRAWEDEGWVSLGRTAGFDAMHVQAARL